MEHDPKIKMIVSAILFMMCLIILFYFLFFDPQFPVILCFSLLTFITGNDFNIPLTVMMLAYVVIGGGQTFWGPVLGALIFTLLPEVARETKEFRLEIFGIAMLATMVFRQQGLITRDMVKRLESCIKRTLVRSKSPEIN